MCLNFWFCMDVQYVREQASNLRALRSARGHADAWYRVQVLRVQGVLHGYELVQCKSRVRTAASPLASFSFWVVPGLYILDTHSESDSHTVPILRTSIGCRHGCRRNLRV